MANQSTQSKTRAFWTPEFVLVCVMLIVLVVLVLIVLWVPIGVVQGTNTSTPPTFEQMADYRKSMLNVIVTVFGAWVGAGAAYFFGRESLKESADSLLAMREPSARERLRQTPVREIPPKILDWKVKKSDNLQPVVTKFEENPKYWFMTVVKADGALETVLEADGLWRFINTKVKEGKTYDEIMQMTVEAMLEPKQVEPFKDRHVTATLDKSAGNVYEQMQNKEVFVAIIVDEGGKPTHFFTTGDVRNVVLQTG